MKNVPPINKTSAPYYVENRFCAGRLCKYQGIIVGEIAEERSGVSPDPGDEYSWSIQIDDAEGNRITITESDLSDIPSEEIATNPPLAIAIYNALLEKMGATQYQLDHTVFHMTSNYGISWIDPGETVYTINVTPLLDIICVTAPPTGDEEMGRAIIYFSSSLTVMARNNIGTLLAYIGGGTTPASFYHLCRHVSFVFGSCREFTSKGDDNRNSNITSANLYVGEADRWEAGSKPVIMDNCMMCDYCIKVCPRKAIHNRMTGHPIPMGQIEYGEAESRKSLKEQVLRNAKAMPGENAYSGQFGSIAGGFYDGRHMYVAYASDIYGEDYSLAYSSEVHTHVAVRLSDDEIDPVTQDIFAGLWELIGNGPSSTWYTYVAYASSAQGDDFSLAYIDGTHTHVATKYTSEYIETPTASDFVGLWRTISTGEDTWDGGEW